MKLFAEVVSNALQHNLNMWVSPTKNGFSKQQGEMENTQPHVLPMSQPPTIYNKRLPFPTQLQFTGEAFRRKMGITDLS